MPAMNGVASAKRNERRTRAIPVPRVRIDKRPAYNRKHEERKREMGEKWLNGEKGEPPA